MINEESNAGRGPERRFDLEERTAVFGEAVIRFCRLVPVNPVTSPLISQLVSGRHERRLELLRSERCGVEKGLQAQDRHLPQGIEGVEVPDTDDGRGGGRKAR